ncbi:MAG: TlpA family protein disulfide reductase [Phycisphaerae bacterium]|jgi:thiol-disulfide isomerase/thioredoxin|nr:TlpA family protein disulfide reductase [Phycisphaerae bacterium]
MKLKTITMILVLATSAQAVFAGSRKDAIKVLQKVHDTYRSSGAIIESIKELVTSTAKDLEPSSTTKHLLLGDKCGKVTSQKIVLLWTDGMMYVTHKDLPNYYVEQKARTFKKGFESLELRPPLAVVMQESRDLDSWMDAFFEHNTFSKAEIVGVDPNQEVEGEQVVEIKADTYKNLVYVSSDNVITKVVHISSGDGGDEIVFTREFETQLADKIPAITFDTSQKAKVETLKEFTALAKKKESELKAKEDSTEKSKPKNKNTNPAPDFTLQKLDGSGKVTLSELKGKVVVLDFWSTWCGPCKRGLPLLNKYDAENKSDFVEVFAVNVWERGEEAEWLAKVKKFWKTNNYKTAVLLASSNRDLSNSYGVTGIPTTIVIDRDGNIYDKHVGFAANMVEDLKKSVEGAFNATN